LFYRIDGMQNRILDVNGTNAKNVKLDGIENLLQIVSSVIRIRAIPPIKCFSLAWGLGKVDSDKGRGRVTGRTRICKPEVAIIWIVLTSIVS
jgi:hypothetical protein